MSYLNQKTIKNNISFTGIGLHSGKKVKVTLKSSEPDTGIVFHRVDLKNKNLIYPNFKNVSNTSLNTTVSNEFGIKVSTIEHLMGAIFGLGIDNLLIEIDAEEVPILDGSSKNFVEAIELADLEISDQPIKIITIDKEVVYEEGGKSISFKPSKISLEIDFHFC